MPQPPAADPAVGGMAGVLTGLAWHYNAEGEVEIGGVLFDAVDDGVASTRPVVGPRQLLADEVEVDDE